jgi:hypothetical protein
VQDVLLAQAAPAFGVQDSGKAERVALRSARCRLRAIAVRAVTVSRGSTRVSACGAPAQRTQTHAATRPRGHAAEEGRAESVQPLARLLA